MTITITEDTRKESDRRRFFGRLKNKFFSLYETEQELSVINADKKTVISSSEFDYRSGVRDKQTNLKTEIQNLIDEYKN